MQQDQVKSNSNKNLRFSLHFRSASRMQSGILVFHYSVHHTTAGYGPLKASVVKTESDVMAAAYLRRGIVTWTPMIYYFCLIVLASHE